MRRTSNKAIPRYIVQLPEGERELDALEMVRLYGERIINFSTPIRPVAGGESRRFDAEPEFAPLLGRLYQSQRFALSAWRAPLLMLWGPLLVFLAMPWLLPWSWVRLGIVLLEFSLLALPMALAEYCDKTPGSPLKRCMWPLCIPYWNTWAGWWKFKQMALKLPDSRRCWARIVNPVFWLLLGLFYGGCVWFPSNATGGILLWILLGLVFLTGAALAVPFRIGVHAEYRRWQAENPKPPAIEKRSSSRPEPKWFRFNWRKMLGDLPVLGGVLLAAAIIATSFYLTGKIRCCYYERQFWEQNISMRVESYLFEAAKPNAAEEIFTIELPEYQLESTAAEAEKCRPQLAKFRAMLRKYERLGIKRSFSTASKIDEAHIRIRNYLCWSWLLPDNPPAEMLLDLERYREYETSEDPYYGVYSELSYSGRRNAILEKYLARLSDAELQAEKARLIRDIDNLPGKTRYYVYANNIIFSDRLMISKFPFLFRDNLRATGLQIAMEEALLRCREYYENHQDYLKFIKANRERVFPFDIFGSDYPEKNAVYSHTLANYRLALAAVELEQYRRKHGEYPTAPELPRDPFSGNPLRYIPGKMLYSVYADGGRQKKRHEKDSTDIVFNLNLTLAEEK